MSTNGDIEIAVSAEGADEAAADLGGDGDGAVGGGGGGGGGDDGGGGLRGNLRSGAIAGALISALGPLLDVVSPILEVLNAFVAPVATMLLRLLQPVLRFLLTRVLPAWLDFMDFSQGIFGDWASLFAIMATALPALLVPLVALEMLGIDVRSLLSTTVDTLSSLAGDIWTAISSGASWLVGGASNIGGAVWSAMSGWASTIRETLGSLPGDIWEQMQALPGQIASAISNNVPGVGGGDGSGGGLLGSLPSVDDVQSTVETRNSDDVSSGNGSNGGTTVNITGGLNSFVDNISEDQRLDL